MITGLLSALLARLLPDGLCAHEKAPVKTPIPRRTRLIFSVEQASPLTTIPFVEEVCRSPGFRYEILHCRCKTFHAVLFTYLIVRIVVPLPPIDSAGETLTRLFGSRTPHSADRGTDRRILPRRWIGLSTFAGTSLYARYIAAVRTPWVLSARPIRTVVAERLTPPKFTLELLNFRRMGPPPASKTFRARKRLIYCRAEIKT